MTPRIFQKTQPPGQSIIEAILGIAILIAGATTSLALGIITIRAGQVSQSRTVADNLAREGIEIVRMMRDSNWLANDPGIDWKRNLCDPPGGNDFTAALSFDPIDQTVPLSLGFASANSFADDTTRIFQRNYYQPPDNTKLLYTYFVQTLASPPSNTTVTPFRRLITITPTPAGPCTNQTNTLTVKSEVQWTEYGAVHSSELIEQLTNWRP